MLRHPLRSKDSYTLATSSFQDKSKPLLAHVHILVKIHHIAWLQWLHVNTTWKHWFLKSYHKESFKWQIIILFYYVFSCHCLKYLHKALISFPYSYKLWYLSQPHQKIKHLHTWTQLSIQVIYKPQLNGYEGYLHLKSYSISSACSQIKHQE